MDAERLRIVSLLPSATEMVCALGLQDQLIGISHECNWPLDIAHKPRVTKSNVDSSAGSIQIDVQVKALLSAGKALYEVDADLLVSLAPDLIVTQAQCDVCDISYESVLELIASHEALSGTQVIALNPTSLEEVLDDIQCIGEAADIGENWQCYRDSLQIRIDAVVAKKQPTNKRPRTIVIEWTDPLMIAGNWTPELIRMAGGEYGLARPGEHSHYVEWNEIVDFAPEVIVVAPCGFDLSRSKQELQQLAAIDDWHKLPAVAFDRVYAVDGDAFFNRPGPRLVDSLEMLAGWLSHCC